MADTADHGSEWAPWRSRIEAARRRKNDLIPEWQRNVLRRSPVRGSSASADTVSTITTDDRTVSVNKDWPLTKAKIAQLYSQTPEVRLSPRGDQFQQAVPLFARELNDTIGEAALGQTVEEVLADVINASGIGGALVYYETRTEPRDVPLIDPAMLPPGATPPTTTVDAVVDGRHCVDRISPADLLIPTDFTGSTYDKARWLGHESRCTWAQAVQMFGLTDEQKERVLGKDKRAGATINSLNADTTNFRDTDVVNYTQLFYWRHYYHQDETSFKAIQRVVFVDGLDDPVVDEEYTGQQRSPNGMLGAVTLPIRILTLTYISDEALPPSDSSIWRHQVSELEAIRDSQQQQRQHSIPLRWFDSNRISSNTKSLLEKGTHQGFIPTNGPGDRAVGEVARASYPQDRYEYDAVLNRELAEIAQVGTNQAGAFSSGDRSASEAKIVQQNFQTRVGQERDRVTRFVLDIAQVLAGHLSLFGTFDVPDTLGVTRQQLATGFSYSVRVDSTVRQDAQQRIDQLERVINYLAQSPYANVKPLVAEYVELNGLDPNTIVVDPQPKPPEPVKISISTAEDFNNPIALAHTFRTHQAPAPDDLAAAIKMLQTAGGLPVPPMAPPAPAGPGGAPQPTETMTNPDWQAAPRLDKRDEDGGA